MSPTEKLSSGSTDSILDFQKRMLSGSPLRSRGPASSSRKKSASWASNARRPLGTIFGSSWSVEGVKAGVTKPVLPESVRSFAPPIAPGARAAAWSPLSQPRCWK